MTDKEMAEEYTNNLLKGVNCTMGNPRARQINSIDVEEAFLAGLKAGRPKWHKVADGYLPNDRRNVWIKYINAYYQTETTEASFRHKYWVINGHRTECNIIAWCEIPK